MAYSDRTWLITGTSSGFGKAIAREVLDRGGRVIATARDPGSVADLVAEYGDRVLPLALDVTDKAQIAAAIVRSDAFGGVDVLVNNAGYGFLGGVEESSEDEIADQMDVNFYGALKMIRAVLPACAIGRAAATSSTCPRSQASALFPAQDFIPQANSRWRACQRRWPQSLKVLI
jgi:NADP-dependent 3-hydroxy acid dehydrogenase YdfG